jgi:hypothetical protein
MLRWLPATSRLKGNPRRLRNPPGRRAAERDDNQGHQHEGRKNGGQIEAREQAGFRNGRGRASGRPGHCVDGGADCRTRLRHLAIARLFPRRGCSQLDGSGSTARAGAASGIGSPRRRWLVQGESATRGCIGQGSGDDRVQEAYGALVRVASPRTSCAAERQRANGFEVGHRGAHDADADAWMGVSPAHQRPAPPPTGRADDSIACGRTSNRSVWRLSYDSTCGARSSSVRSGTRTFTAWCSHRLT